MDPLGDLGALARVPAEIIRDLRVIAGSVEVLPEIAEGVRSLPAIVGALRILPAIENHIVALEAVLKPALTDVHEVREIIGSLEQQVIHIEEMIQRLDRHAAVLERTVVDLQSKAGHAMQLLPDPDDDNRTVLEKAKDAITAS